MDNSLKLTALEQKQLESLLKQAGSRTVSAETLAATFAEGAPRNADGTVNLIEFAAWLAKGVPEDGN